MHSSISLKSSWTVWRSMLGGFVWCDWGKNVGVESSKTFNCNCPTSTWNRSLIWDSSFLFSIWTAFNSVSSRLKVAFWVSYAAINCCTRCMNCSICDCAVCFFGGEEGVLNIVEGSRQIYRLQAPNHRSWSSVHMLVLQPQCWWTFKTFVFVYARFCCGPAFRRGHLKF